MSRPWRSSQGCFDAEDWVFDLSFPSDSFNFFLLTIGCLGGEKLKGVSSTKFPTEWFSLVLWLVFGFLYKKLRLGSVGRSGILRPDILRWSPTRAGVLWRVNILWCGDILNFLFLLLFLDYAGVCLVERICVVELTRKKRSTVWTQRPSVFNGNQFI